MKTEPARRVAGSILLLITLAAQTGMAQTPTVAPPTPEAHYRAFDKQGRRVTLQEVVEALGAADVLLVGETHNDPVAHLLEAELLRRADERFGRADSRGRRPVALSLEMFERDVQLVLDEYLGGLIGERHFLSSSRPWKNYQTDYRPLVEYARVQKLPVIAANAPARYVSRVSASGPDSLASLSAAAKGLLPPLPFPPASREYGAKFTRFMRGDAPAHPTPNASTAQAPANPHAAHGGASFLLEAQTLRDASMGHSIAEFLKQRPDALVVHVNGKFHSEERLGVAEQLQHYRPRARVLVLTIVPGEGFPDFDAARVGGLGDFIILTDPALPRSSS
ncbi:MAG TPA: ChaN family lipoprotein [Pyrinomonadaceae bacterium]|nr:ChaN family lipoprotein [Pyrinomonadaceae bacterium]